MLGAGEAGEMMGGWGEQRWGIIGGLVAGLGHGFPLRDGNPSTMLLVLVSDAPGRHRSLESTLIKFYFSKRDEASR